ncbi:hypothetical protein QJQ45_001058 [Haematococcus lacustris]|nr:hypothetical protein QJQ45_001058 [Haematococcus lacustris]
MHDMSVAHTNEVRQTWLRELPDGAGRLARMLNTLQARTGRTVFEVFNNGHTVQVQWNTAELRSRILVPNVGGHVVDVARSSVNASYLPVIATPLQLHFHTTSEHTLEGAYYPLELHIVHVVPQTSLPACPASGCLAVAGVMLALSDDDADNPTLDSIWSVMPVREGLVNYMPVNTTLNIQALLPRNRTYVQYSGSLTTPPCTEGVLWHSPCTMQHHCTAQRSTAPPPVRLLPTWLAAWLPAVFTNPVTISLRQLRAYELAVGLKECEGRSNRKLQASAQTHRKLATSHAPPTTHSFVRGAYSGFVRSPPATTTFLGAGSNVQAADATLLAMAAQLLPSSMRRLSGDDSERTAAGECRVVSMGFSNRDIMPINNRTRLVYRPVPEDLDSDIADRDEALQPDLTEAERKRKEQHGRKCKLAHLIDHLPQELWDAFLDDAVQPRVEACSERAVLASLLLGLLVRGLFTIRVADPLGLHDQPVYTDIPVSQAAIPDLSCRKLFLQLVRGLPGNGANTRPNAAVAAVLAAHPDLRARLAAIPRHPSDTNMVDHVGKQLETAFSNMLTLLFAGRLKKSVSLAGAKVLVGTEEHQRRFGFRGLVGGHLPAWSKRQCTYVRRMVCGLDVSWLVGEGGGVPTVAMQAEVALPTLAQQDSML